MKKGTLSLLHIPKMLTTVILMGQVYASVYAIPTNTPQTLHAIPTSTSQTLQAIPTSTPQTLYSIPTNTDQTLHAIPTSTSQTLYSIPTNADQTLHTIPTSTSQTLHAIPNNTPQPLLTEWLGDEPMTVERIVTEVVDYFSQQDPHGIPVLTVPEPIYEENKVAAGPLTLWELEIEGLSQIRLDYINVNLTEFTAIVRVSLPMINVQGQYEWPGWFSSSAGDANITMTGIQLSLEIALGMNDEGILRVDILTLSVIYEELILGFTGLNTEHSYTVGAADLFFSSIIQPIIVGNLQEKVTNLLDSKLQKALKDRPFPDSISPFDFAVAKMRRRMREKNMDPYVIERKEINMAWEITLVLKDITLAGLTTIHRTHEIAAEFIDNAIFATLQIGTQELKVGADWSVSAALLPAISGHLDIEVESLAITVEMRQPANIRNPPLLRKIDIQLGNLAVRSAGEGTVDYVLELLINIMPNIFRDIIMEKVEPKIHQIIQRELNGLDLHRTVMDKLEARRRRREEEAEAAEATEAS